jgi:hypothetical protein
MIQDLLTEGAKTGDLRDDVAPDELASYCLHALTAASSLSSKAAVRRLVTVTLAGLRPRSPQSPGGLCRACVTGGDASATAAHPAGRSTTTGRAIVKKAQQAPALHLDERLTAYPRLPLVAAREWAEMFTPAAVEVSSAAEEGREQDRSGQ